MSDERSVAEQLVADVNDAWIDLTEGLNCVLACTCGASLVGDKAHVGGCYGALREPVLGAVKGWMATQLFVMQELRYLLEAGKANKSDVADDVVDILRNPLYREPGEDEDDDGKR